MGLSTEIACAERQLKQARKHGMDAWAVSYCEQILKSVYLLREKVRDKTLPKERRDAAYVRALNRCGELSGVCFAWGRYGAARKPFPA